MFHTKKALQSSVGAYEPLEGTYFGDADKEIIDGAEKTLGKEVEFSSEQAPAMFLKPRKNCGGDMLL